MELCGLLLTVGLPSDLHDDIFRDGNRNQQMKQNSNITAAEGSSFWQDGVDTSHDDTKRIGRLLGLLRGRLHWAILLALFLGSAGGVAGYFLKKPMYMGAGQIEIIPKLQTIMYQTDEKNIPPMFHSYFDTELAKMQSSRVLSRASSNEQWRKAVSESTREVSQLIERWRLSVKRGGNNSYLVSVSYEHEDPKLAATGANAVIDAYLQIANEREQEKENVILGELYKYKEELERQLHELQQKRQKLIDQYGIESVEAVYNNKLGQRDELEKELKQIQLEISLVSGETDTEGSGDDAIQHSIAYYASVDKKIQELIEEKEDIEDQLEEMEALGRGENHREVIKQNAMLDLVNQQIDRRAQALRTGKVEDILTDDMSIGDVSTLGGLRIREQQLKQMLDKVKQEATELGRVNMEMRTLEEEIAITRQQLEKPTLEIKKRNIESALSNRLNVMNYASTPDEPYNDGKRKQLVVMGVVGGVSTGFAVMLIIGWFDPRLRHIDDPHSVLTSHRVLGMLPTLPQDLSDPQEAEIAALSVHHIRTLLQIGHTGRSRVYSITSPAAGSGKSSLCVALGLSFAASGARTLLIDCDVVGSGLSRMLHSIMYRPIQAVLREMQLVTDDQLEKAERIAAESGRPLKEVVIEQGLLTRDQSAEIDSRESGRSIGLLNACNGEAIQSCIFAAQHNKLHILPTGSARPQDAGSLSPDMLNRVIAKAREQYDVVLIDTGPVLGSLEATMVTGEVDGVIFIASRGDDRTLTSRSLESLQSIHARIAGIVFNHALGADLERSTYGSISMSQNRRMHADSEAAASANTLRIDTEVYGPLGSAVASFMTGSRHH